MTDKLILWFEEVDKQDISLVGGKGANLGEMLNARFPIPYGFILTAKAYFDFIDQNNIAAKIKNVLSSTNVDNHQELSNASSTIKNLIVEGEVPELIIEKTVQYYHRLMSKEAKIYRKKDSIRSVIKSAYNPPLVAVRSSATAEDLPTASFAGQQETYLNVKGENHLINKVRDCWASLFTERAIYYREKQGFDHFKVGLAAVVQRMIQSDKSGIAFSVDPVTNDKLIITIEAIFGLGEYIVQGKETPDHYEVEKKSLSIVKKEIKRQTAKYVKKGGNNVEIKLTKKEGERQKLTDLEIIKLAQLTKEIEKHYYFPQDIEWAVEKGRIYIVQSRPITTITKKETVKAEADGEEKKEEKIKGKILVKGDPASPGLGSGQPVIITGPRQINKIKKGDVLVAHQTNPDFVPAMKKAAAIVTEVGGRTSHAAIVSRELGIPAVVGAEEATERLKIDQVITVNGSTGEVYLGSFERQKKDNAAKKSTKKDLKTLTKIYVNLADPDQAKAVAKMGVDGVGLLRAEFMIADIGVHPKLFIEQKKEKEFIEKLYKKLLVFAKAFSPRPVVYRATDFKTNEYRHLKGGNLYEPAEENPMLGFRGASRYIADEKVFVMELEAIKKVRKTGYKNIYLMIPFVRTPEELAKIKSILKKNNLDNLSSFKLWIMIEVPSTVILLEEFIKKGIDGVSIGTNDLTMLLLGVDRDNQEIAHLYNEKDAAVLWALERVVKTCTKHNVTSSVCGQAPSDYPELIDLLVEWGITSLSLNPDAVERARLHVHQLESKLWQKLRK